jgi:uncharacterized lipoprotein YmbA
VTADLNSRRRLLALLCLAGVVGCATTPPPRTLIVIPSLPVAPLATRAADGSAAVPASLQVVVGVVSVPEQWQHRSVRYQGQEAALVAWPGSIWAERIEVGLTRRLSQGMRVLMPAHGWWTHEDQGAKARLLVDIQQLDVDPAAGSLSAVVNWRLLSRQGTPLSSGAVSDHRNVVIRGADEQARVMGEWVDALARSITDQLPPAAFERTDSKGQ